MTPAPFSTPIDVTTDLSGTYVKRDDVQRGDLSSTIAGVSRETFEARDGRPAATRVVLTSADTPARKFSLNKGNLRTVAGAFGKTSNLWLGRTITIYHDPTIEVGGVVKGGQRVRMPVARPTAPTADVHDLEAQIRTLKAQLQAAPSRVPGEDDGDDPIAGVF